MELDKFHVLYGDACPQGHTATVTGTGVRPCTTEVCTTIAAGGENGLLCLKTVQGAIVEVPSHDAAALTVRVHDQVYRKVFNEKLSACLQGLLVQSMQHGMSGSVSGGTGPLGNALPVFRGHATKRTLVNFAIIRPTEWHAIVLKLDDRLGRLTRHVLNSVLITQPVAAFDGIVHVPLPLIFAHVAQTGCDAALRRNGVRTGWKHLGNVGRFQASLSQAQGCAQARSACTDNDHVVFVIDNIV